jgi:hypothetical protein
METQNASSSLIALRELREGDKRRQREAEQARAKAEREMLICENTERQAAEAFERAQSTRLGRELDAARTEIAHLRGELEQSYRARFEAAPPPRGNRGRTVGWLGLSAGATMLVGALALSAAMQPAAKPTSLAAMAPRPAAACPELPVVAPTAPEPSPTPTAASPAPGRKRPARVRHPPSSRERGKPSATTVCDGTDPLCGLPSGLSDDLDSKRGKRSR